MLNCNRSLVAQFICSQSIKMILPASLTYVGHATILLEMNGLRILTDPVLRRHVGGFIRRQVPLPAAQIKQIDLVLISHLHFDHLDLPSLRLLGYKMPMLVPSGAGQLLRRYGFTQVQEMMVGEKVTVGGVQIEATIANHSGGRPPFGPTSACLGYILRGQQTIYFAGDTDLFPEMSALEQTLDLALLPVWGWGPTLGEGHMDPHRAAQALTLLKPRFAIPIHWGTLYPLGMSYLRPRLLSAPPLLFAHHARELAPAVDIHIIKPGQVFDSFN